jgi:DNA-binding NtrC family response regulator
MSEPSILKQVLIVEDDAKVRGALREVFVADGYQCRVAANGREGLDAFLRDRPPLTLTDIRMPVMNGLEFLKRARAVDADAAIIVITGVGDVKTAIESLKCGAYDFIVKPVNVEGILISAERALERRQMLLERREYHTLLERRVEEATRGLAAALN